MELVSFNVNITRPERHKVLRTVMKLYLTIALIIVMFCVLLAGVTKMLKAFESKTKSPYI
jgi:hypothetical protein